VVPVVYGAVSDPEEKLRALKREMRAEMKAAKGFARVGGAEGDEDEGATSSSSAAAGERAAAGGRGVVKARGGCSGSAAQQYSAWGCAALRVV
jgi:hypothetical protein